MNREVDAHRGLTAGVAGAGERPTIWRADPHDPPPPGRATRLTALSLAGAALLAACAAPAPPRPPAGPPPLTASPSVPPAFPVPGACERMVHLARQEWTLFGAPEVVANGEGAGSRLAFAEPAAPTHELHAPMLARVLVYWYGVSRAPIVGTGGELRPWSAAFVSWLARGAGYVADEFPATVLHWDYIERFLRPRPGDAFETRDPLRHPPRVGDLVCTARDGSVDAAARTSGYVAFAALRRGAYHCDLVVAARPGELQTIGGNVSDVVALQRVPVATDGRLMPDARRPWAAVVARRDGGTACAAMPPVPPRGPGPPTT
jgi:hypothetical protein